MNELVLPEYHFEYDRNTIEPIVKKTSYDELPIAVQQNISDFCHTPEDIQSVWTGKLEYYKTTAFFISFSDTTDITFDKKGNCLRMAAWRPQGLPECLIAKVPNFDKIRQYVTDDMNRITSKPWDFRCIEIHPNGYLVKTGQCVDISVYYFDKKGNLMWAGVEI